MDENDVSWSPAVEAGFDLMRAALRLCGGNPGELVKVVAEETGRTYGVSAVRKWVALRWTAAGTENQRNLVPLTVVVAVLRRYPSLSLDELARREPGDVVQLRTARDEPELLAWLESTVERLDGQITERIEVVERVMAGMAAALIRLGDLAGEDVRAIARQPAAEYERDAAEFIRLARGESSAEPAESEEDAEEPGR